MAKVWISIYTRVIKVAKKLTKGKRKYLTDLVETMATNARAEKLREVRVKSIRNELRDYRGRRVIDIIF